MVGPGRGLPHRGWIVVAVGSPISPADLPALCTTVRTRLEHSGAEVVVIDLGAVGVADAVTVDAMARLALTARRLGREVQLRDAPSELHDLLGFTGLSDVVELGARLPPVLQRQAEEGEEALDVEEEAELDDPAV